MRSGAIKPRQGGKPRSEDQVSLRVPRQTHGAGQELSLEQVAANVGNGLGNVLSYERSSG